MNLKTRVEKAEQRQEGKARAAWVIYKDWALQDGNALHDAAIRHGITDDTLQAVLHDYEKHRNLSGEISDPTLYEGMRKLTPDEIKQGIDFLNASPEEYRESSLCEVAALSDILARHVGDPELLKRVTDEWNRVVTEIADSINARCKGLLAA